MFQYLICQTTNATDRDADESSAESSEMASGFSSTAHESKEGIRSRSVAAKQEGVQKARNFLKRLTPDEKSSGYENTKAHGSKGLGAKGTGSKNGSTCIHSPLEVKSLVIKSRETR